MSNYAENKTPKLRFNEFQNNWGSEKINNITELRAGGTPSTQKEEYWNGHIPWMNSGELNLICQRGSFCNVFFYCGQKC